jgi:hypothetical protein
MDSRCIKSSMLMRHSRLPVALLGAALSLLPGCEGMRSSGPPRSGAEPRKDSPPRSEDPEDSWQGARVGDRVTYAFSAHAQEPLAPARSLSGLASLEVVAVEQPWVWVRLSFTDEGGRPLSPPPPAHGLLLPVRTDVTRPLELEPEGAASAERLATLGRAWEAVRYVQDLRPLDGPLRTRVYAVRPGPLYLTHGLLDAGHVLAGFRARGELHLTLADYREGSAEATATPPALARPPGPEVHYDVRLDVGGEPQVRRTCLLAERGFLLRTERPVSGSESGPPCPDFSDAEVQPMGELLMEWVWQGMRGGSR